MSTPPTRTLPLSRTAAEPPGSAGHRPTVPHYPLAESETGIPREPLDGTETGPHAPGHGVSPEWAPEEEPGRRRPAVLLAAGLGVFALIVVFFLLRPFFDPGPSVAERFETVEITGEQWPAAQDQLREAGISDNEYEVIEPSSGHEGIDLVVDRVQVHGDEQVSVHLSPDVAQLVESLGLEGMSWPEAEAELTAAGLDNGTDYHLRTDAGDIYREANWSVAEVNTTGDTPVVVLSNDLRSGIEDAARGAGDWTQEQWDQLQNRWEDFDLNDQIDGLRNFWNADDDGN
ncbi:hypothetical protein [Nesterenkonia alba]|uniref:hypothetical protein n=1 Tax=Nesterenkonia alba TaxID=515814 RepID=UPI0003B4E1D0|nr:hypothetical protein [Nesterenkonia alba]